MYLICDYGIKISFLCTKIINSYLEAVLNGLWKGCASTNHLGLLWDLRLIKVPTASTSLSQLWLSEIVILKLENKILNAFREHLDIEND
ncbi:MAG TPA: hypothetical protein DCZ88_11190 [Pseudanabaena sp.]|nr:hypothetical protein [Pseudanabaena sp.]